jgi:hypothetical protein
MENNDKHDVDVPGGIFSGGLIVEVSGSDRLRFAKQILFGLALICTGIIAGYAGYPDNKALTQLSELVKIGALPIVTLVISFYFPNGTRK